MADKRSDRIKYKLLKSLDISGFTVFDPMVRLAFAEEPKKQVKSIFRFLIVPIIFVFACIGLWWQVAPNHKTKSGEVPTPDVVWRSAVNNDTFSNREKTKESDFLLEGPEREEALAVVESTILEREATLETLRTKLSGHESDYAELLESQLAPLQAKLDTLKERNDELEAVAKEAVSAAAAAIEAGTGTPQELLEAMRKQNEIKDNSRESEGMYKDQIDAIRSEKYKPLEQARMQVNTVADEVQFLKKRTDFLSDSNRSVRVAEAKEKLAENLKSLEEATTAKKAETEAKKVLRSEASIERLENQQYASAMTIYTQIKRSLFTVFVGFITAAIIAIPLGVLCGLSPIAMACLTPVISIFKPVSPVVYLLIFQIVVGAFFPDPDSHPFFLFINSLPFIGGLAVNPALVFSACTVAACAVWPALVNTALGVASIDGDHINVARVLRLGFWDRLVKIIIPSALPLVFAGLRISLGVGWMVLIAAEALSSSDGLGKFVWDEYQNGSSLSFANILYACFVVGSIGFLLDRMMIVLQRLVSFDGKGTSL
ncbi:MAG: ABC transporter permease subunit [Verrucomicrobiota bacterium]